MKSHNCTVGSSNTNPSTQTYCTYLRQGTQLPDAEVAFFEAALVSLADAPDSFARSSNASSCAACSPPGHNPSILRSKEDEDEDEDEKEEEEE